MRGGAFSSSHTSMKGLFIELFESFLTTFVASLHATSKGELGTSKCGQSSWTFTEAFHGWDKLFADFLKSRTKLLRYRFDGVLGRLCGFIACRNGSQGSDHSLELVRLNLRHSQMIAAPVRCTVVILMSRFSIIRSSDGVPGSTARRTTNIQALKNRLRERGGRRGGRGMSRGGSGRHSGPNSESVCSSCHLLLWT